jgi:homogentisate 1,2-dioxygenase
MKFEKGKLVEITSAERHEIRDIVYNSSSYCDANMKIATYLNNKGYSKTFSENASFHTLMVVMCGFGYCKEVRE